MEISCPSSSPHQSTVSPVIHTPNQSGTFVTKYEPTGLPWWLRWQSICLKCRRLGFDPWVRKIPWRRKWQPTPAFLPEKSHGQRSLVGYSPWGCKESDTTSLSLSFHCIYIKINKSVSRNQERLIHLFIQQILTDSLLTYYLYIYQVTRKHGLKIT